MVGSCVVESGLANKFPEHLNAEIILGTICSVGAAAAWVRSTYLYMRMRRNPGHYGLPEHIETEELDTRILEMCGAALETMAGVGLVLRRGEGVGGTGLGRLMSRHLTTRVEATPDKRQINAERPAAARRPLHGFGIFELLSLGAHDWTQTSAQGPHARTRDIISDNITIA